MRKRQSSRRKLGRSAPVFQLADFRFFMMKAEKRNDADLATLSNKLLSFAIALSDSPVLDPARRLYGKKAREEDFVNPGEFRKDAFSLWVSFGPKSTRNRCHFTLRVEEEGLAFEAFCPEKAFTQRLLTKIRTKRSAFLKSLRTLSPAKDRYHFRLREAYYCDPTDPYKGERICSRIDYVKVLPSVLSKENVDEFIVLPTKARLKEKTFRPEVFLVGHFPLSDIVDNPNAVDLVATAVAPMMPYYSFAFRL